MCYRTNLRLRGIPTKGIRRIAIIQLAARLDFRAVLWFLGNYA